MSSTPRTRSGDGPLAAPEQPYPGQSIGLPASGAGSLAPWRNRVAALIADWAASMLVATGAFGVGVVRGHDWRAWMPYAVFFVESVVLTALMGGSFGQLLARIAVVRLGHGRMDGRMEWWRAAARTTLKCLVLPALVIGADRRGLDDMVLGTAVVNRR